MANKTKSLLYFLLILSVVAAFYGYLEFNQTATSTENLESEFQIEVADLVTDFLKDENRANQKYLGKIISVAGTLQSVEKTAASGVSFVMQSEDGSAVINGMAEAGKESDFNDLRTGASITVRGSVSGFDDLFGEVKLANCVLE